MGKNRLNPLNYTHFLLKFTCEIIRVTWGCEMYEFPEDVSGFLYDNCSHFYFGEVGGQRVVIAAKSEQEFKRACRARGLDGGKFNKVGKCQAICFFAVGGIVHSAEAILGRCRKKAQGLLPLLSAL